MGLFKESPTEDGTRIVRIALTSLYLPSGSKIGVGYQVHALANALVIRGHDVTVFSPCSQPQEALYRVHQVPTKGNFRTFRFPWDLRHINFDRFDVLNAHGDDWFLWGVRRPRHVHTFHGSCLAEMLNITGISRKLRMGLLAACELQAILLADETVAVSENTRRYIPGIRHVVPCGVNLDAFKCSEVRSPSPSILFVGTMDGRKRGRMLLNIFQKEILPRLPLAELWCVCERPDDLDEIQGVRWFGRIPETTLAELYGKAWVFCLPSSYEGFGVPYIEAMASGTPVIATPNPGAVEVTENGRYGNIARPDQLGASIFTLLTNDVERRRMGVVGLKRAESFSWPSICERYEALYASETISGLAA